ncbi:DUF2156 domain-containing protein [Azotosporobacter soli]|uniref:DUF2156 domain-containing protein n=1 Tax=Azotosporobacter soli TaxID=3055040 RepID=UPI0031FEDCAE
MEFQELTLNDKTLFDRYLQAGGYENAHLNFTNLFMWRKATKLRWAESDGYICLKTEWQGEKAFCPPIGEGTGLALLLDKLEDVCRQEGFRLEFRGVENKVRLQLEAARPDYFSFAPDRDDFDYVYRSEDLIKLSGRKYHAKKNHLNSFRKSYGNHEYQTMDALNALDCITFLDDWCRQRGYQSGDELDQERGAVIEALTNFSTLDLSGGIIYVDGAIQAFSFGEQVRPDMAVIHVEKANAELRGIYPAINQRFCQEAWSDVQYINREEDMGLEGLRLAKESYHPVKFVEKYRATLSSAKANATRCCSNVAS